MEPQSYWFHLDDHVRWLGHLESEGFCVVKGAAKAEAGIALPLFWDFLCAQGAISRGDPATWLRANGWPGGGRGFIVESGAGGCNSPAAWALRGAPGVKAAFARIWDTQELLVSFDTFIAWRPWMGVHAPSEFHPVVEGLHLDQNPFSKRGRQCVQGMIPLLPVTAVGGLAVIPRSHIQAAQDILAAQHPRWAVGGDDWCILSHSSARRLQEDVAVPKLLVLVRGSLEFCHVCLYLYQ